MANAANDRLWMGAGVAGAIKRAGGDEIEQEAMAQGPIALGSAVATDGGGLPRALGDPRCRDGPGPADERRARAPHDALLSRARRRARLPARSRCPRSARASAGFPLGECARIMLEEARSFEPRSLERVIFAVFGGEAYEAFSSALSSPLPDGS